MVTLTRPAPDSPVTSMVRQFVLRLLQVVLHGLGLLHQAGELSLVEHGVPPQGGLPWEKGSTGSYAA
jgi:hypothetical protein